MLVLKHFLLFGQIFGGFNFELKRLFNPDDQLNPKKEKRLKRKQEKQRKLNECLEVPNGFVTQFADLFLVSCHQGFCLGNNDKGGTFNCDNGQLKPKAECTCCSTSCDGIPPVDPATTISPPNSSTFSNPITPPPSTISGLVFIKLRYF